MSNTKERGNDVSVYLAHRIPESDREQSVVTHLTNTANKAAEFAAAFSASEAGYMCGMLHDIGKYSAQFQRRIRGSSEQVDHSTAGALEAFRLGNVPAAFCIAGHHSGLPDRGNRKGAIPEEPTFWGKMSRVAGKDIPDYSAFQTEVKISSCQLPQRLIADNTSAFFFTRMLYSCLVDADFLDTESFMSEGKAERLCGGGLPLLLEKLQNHITSWQKPNSELNQKRSQILHAAAETGKEERGLFTLTVPTGGGKTISSMMFALQHAVKNGLRRVIYVIPYTSIIEQTQSVFEQIFGEENVIAHYANVEYGTVESNKSSDVRYLAAENWNAPIVLTTSVQFFESLYSNRSSRCRKLHNIAKSMIIFDEAQMLPIPYLQPCVSAISHLIRHYGCSSVMCTATQPALDKLFIKMLPEYQPKEICPDAAEMYESFRRARFQRAGLFSDEQLAARLAAEKQVLCIVNNRRQAQMVFSLLKQDGFEQDGSFHLSTTMYPAHRRRILAEIRQRLMSGLACRVVSTSLVEAGVDVDFPTVYREVSGLDSMIQAGGRCNREGKRSACDSIVYLFESESKPPEAIRPNISAAERVMRSYQDIASPEAIKAYFSFLYYTLKGEDELDAKLILPDIASGAMPFASVAERFKLIETSEFALYIPEGEGSELIETLRRYGPNRSLMRRLGQYSVGVYPQHYRRLLETGATEKLFENAAVLRDLSLYSEETGLSFGVKEGQALIL